jgi:hypothetical protein
MYSVQGLEILYDLMILQYMYQRKEKEKKRLTTTRENIRRKSELDIHIRLFSRHDQDHVE